MNNLYRHALSVALLSTLLSLSLSSISQTELEKFTKDKRSDKLEIRQLSSLTSNQLDFPFLKEKYWSKELKNEQLNRGVSISKFGQINTSDVLYTLKRKEHKAERYIRLRHQQLFGISVDPDLTSIALLGNTQFKGQEISIQRSNVEINRMTCVVLGKSVELKKPNQHFSLGLGLAFGHRLSNFHSEEGSLQFDSINEFIHSDFDFESVQTTKNNLSGIGLVFDLNYKKSTPSNYWEFRLEDLGFMNWGNIRTQSNKNTLSVFEGFYIEDITSVGGNWLDTLQTEQLEETNNPSIVLTPFRASLNLESSLQKNNYLKLDLRYLHAKGYFPYSSIRYGMHMNKSDIEFGLAYGAYGEVRSSWRSSHLISKNLVFYANLEGIESFFMNNLPINTRGQLGLIFALNRLDQ